MAIVHLILAATIAIYPMTEGAREQQTAKLIEAAKLGDVEAVREVLATTNLNDKDVG